MAKGKAAKERAVRGWRVCIESSAHKVEDIFKRLVESLVFKLELISYDNILCEADYQC